MQSLLTGITAADIKTDPFPHILVRDVMDPAVYRALSESFPPFSKIGWDSPRLPPSNHRYQLPASQIIDHTDMAEVWKDFAALHSSPAFFAQVVALFQDYWAEALTRHLGGSLLGHSMGLFQRDSHKGSRILQDARIEINTPVTAGPSSSRGAHLDTSNRLFTGLLYLRHPDDDAVGGDLELFRWTHGPVAPLDSYCLPADAVEVVATIPYRPNQLVMFPQGLNALHGVSIRQPTPHTRRYVFISAELGEDWLTLPAAEAAQ